MGLAAFRALMLSCCSSRSKSPFNPTRSYLSSGIGQCFLLGKPVGYVVSDTIRAMVNPLEILGATHQDTPGRILQLGGPGMAQRPAYWLVPRSVPSYPLNNRASRAQEQGLRRRPTLTEPSSSTRPGYGSLKTRTRPDQARRPGCLSLTVACMC